MRKKILKLIEVGAVLAGFMFVGSFGLTPFSDGASLSNMVSLVAICVAVTALVGGVFVFTRMSVDVMEIRRQLEQQAATARQPAPAGEAEPAAQEPAAQEPAAAQEATEE